MARGRQDVLEGGSKLAHGVHADSVALSKLQRMVGKPARRIGRRWLSGEGHAKELERCTMFHAEVRRASKSVVALCGKIGNRKERVRSHGKVLSEWLAPGLGVRRASTAEYPVRLIGKRLAARAASGADYVE